MSLEDATKLIISAGLVTELGAAVRRAQAAGRRPAAASLAPARPEPLASRRRRRTVTSAAYSG